MKFVPIFLALIWLCACRTGNGLEDQKSSDDIVTAEPQELINEIESTSTTITVPIEETTSLVENHSSDTTLSTETEPITPTTTPFIHKTTTTIIEQVLTSTIAKDPTISTNNITETITDSATPASIDTTTVSESTSKLVQHTTMTSTLTELVETTKSMRHNLLATSLNDSSNTTDLLEIYFTKLSSPEPTTDTEIETVSNKQHWYDYRLFYIIICFLLMLIAIPICILLFITFVLLLFDFMTCRGENICLLPYNRLSRRRVSSSNRSRRALKDVRSKSFEKIELQALNQDDNKSRSSYKICNTVRITSFYGDDKSLKPYSSGFFYETQSVLGDMKNEQNAANELNQAEQHLSKSITELDELLSKQRNHYYRNTTNVSVFTQKRDTLKKQSQLEQTELLLDELINELGDEVDNNNKRKPASQRSTDNGLLKVIVTDANGHDSSVQSDDE